VTRRPLLRRARQALRPPRNRAIDDVFATMDAIEEESGKAVTFCEDCGSRRILTRWPDGSVGHLPGHPDDSQWD
jgi:hypothetical protein